MSPVPLPRRVIPAPASSSSSGLPAVGSPEMLELVTAAHHADYAADAARRRDVRAAAIPDPLGVIAVRALAVQYELDGEPLTPQGHAGPISEAFQYCSQRARRAQHRARRPHRRGPSMVLDVPDGGVFLAGHPA